MWPRSGSPGILATERKVERVPKIACQRRDRYGCHGRPCGYTGRAGNHEQSQRRNHCGHHETEHDQQVLAHTKYPFHIVIIQRRQGIVQ